MHAQAMVFRLMAVLAVVASLTWLLRRSGLSLGRARDPRRGYRFTLDFSDGRRTRVDGVVPRHACNAFDEVAALSRLSGRLGARPDGNLEFSDDVPEAVRQRLRNVWLASREP